MSNIKSKIRNLRSSLVQNCPSSLLVRIVILKSGLNMNRPGSSIGPSIQKGLQNVN